MNAASIRSSFLRYFEERGHQVVSSSALIPRNDPSLFFANSGMVQFKGVFTGQESRSYTRATTCQKVMRASGKHNDLENVGFTPRHHTFFEMLGNFSFGDYFKKDAIHFAWDLLTRVYGIDPDRLWITVFREDDEAARIWTDEMGVPAWKVVRMDEADNFWSMGDTGPCGPCSEIHVDKAWPNGPHRIGPDQDPDRFLEIWNLVFMQYERQPGGALLPLPRPSIDTGMGLERITAVLQGKSSNYDTDLFLPIIHRGADMAGINYGDNPDLDTSLRVIADHSRAAAFLIADGIMPSKEARGYVLRRIMRRAIRHGVKLGFTKPFFHETVGVVIEQMSTAFPELLQRQDTILAVVQAEEERFRLTLDNGLKLLRNHADVARSTGGNTLPGEAVFKLYDTFGFPVDLTQVISREEGLEVDLSGFQREMDLQKERARQAWVGSGEMGILPIYRQILDDLGEVAFTGYHLLESDTEVRAILKGGQLINQAEPGDEVELITDTTPFYGESGGQIGDKGEVVHGASVHGVSDTQKPVEGLVTHHVKLGETPLSVGDTVTLRVDTSKRAATRRNHTATHLLHAALKEVLGPHVAQRGSLVSPDRLRFDFSHFQPMSEEQIRTVEDKVNRAVLDNTPLHIHESTLEEATQAGVVALFGEKYGDRVRVVSVPGYSAELCGGTHVHHTGDIGLFKILSEGGIASGIRRIEAQTGWGALDVVRQEEAWLKETGDLLRSPAAEIPRRVQRLLEQVKAQEQAIRHLKAELIDRPTGGSAPSIVEVHGVKVHALECDADSADALREQADRLRDRLGSGVVILASGKSGKVMILVAVTKDLTSRLMAGQIIKPLAEMVGGKGGGKPELAQAGGPDLSRMAEVIEKAPGVVAGFLAS